MQFIIVVAATCLGLGFVPEICSDGHDSPRSIDQFPALNGDEADVFSGMVRVTRAASQVDRDADPPPLTRIPGTPAPVVNACRASVDAIARSLDPVQVDAVSGGLAVRGRDGILRAPLEIQIIYSHGGSQEVRQSRVECHLDRDGRVVALEGLEENADDTTMEAAPARPDEEPLATGSLPPRIGGGDVVEAFYRALGEGDGAAAAQYVVPEKRMRGPLSASEISRYFGGLARPLRAADIVRSGANRFDVRYSYGIVGRDCTGSAQVTLTSRESVTYIASIRASEECS